MSDLSLAIKLSTEGGQVVVKELTQIGQAAGGTNAELVKTGPAGAAAAKGLESTASSATMLNTHMRTLFQTLGVVAGGLSAFALIDRADEWGQYAARIRTATKSAEEYDYVQQRMVNSANDTFRAINETKESFIQMSPILRDMGYQLTQSIDIVDSFSSLLVVNAARADRAAAAQSALAGSIQRGGVDADSWKTIFGTMPTILDNLTAATGKTASEIRELGITGKLSITDLTNALLLSYEENRQAVEAMPTTVRDALQSFSTVFTEYIGWQNEAKGVTAGMADGIVFLADHFDTLVNIVGGVAVAAFANYAIHAGIATKATLGKYAANAALTAQELRLAQAQVVQTKATLAQAAMMARTTGAHAHASVAAEAYRAATLRLTQAQAAQATVGRTLLGVLGGPAGIAITLGIAATAFFGFWSSSNDVKQALEELQQPLENTIEKFKRLNADQRAAALVKWADAQAAEVAKVQAAYRELELTVERQARRAAANDLDAAFAAGLGVQSPLVAQLKEAVAAGEQLTPILQEIGKNAGVSQDTIDEWITLAGAYFDAKEAAETAANAIKKIKEAASVDGLEKLLSGDLFGFKPDLPIAENKELEKALLGVYNAQMLNAKAVDAYGVALTGIDLELFKAQFEAAETLPDDATAAIRRFVAEAKTAQANLDISNYLKQLQTEVGLLDIKLAKGQAEFELQKALAQFTGADPERLKQLEDELKLLQQKQALASDKDTLASLQKENDLLKIRMAQGEAEYEIQKALAQLKGQDPAVIAAIEAELRARQELTKQISISEEIASGAFNQALDDMSALSSAGASFGDAMTQAFGRVAQQIDGMTAAQVNYNQKLDELKAKRQAVEALELNAPGRAKALLDIKNKEASLSREYFQAQMGQFSALTGAAKTMFGEQSREREALHRMEMAFSIAEIAMSIKASGANALKAITEAFAAPFPLNFAAGAAMMGIMAGLGVFSGGSSVSAPSAAERQASQGTGTVLGDSDAKSESIVNALDRIAELSLDQYSELRAINQSIRELNQGIAQLAVNLVRSFGRFDSASYQGALGTEKQFQLGSGLSSFVAGGVIGLGLDKLLDGMIGGIFNSILGGISKTTRNLLDSGLSFEAAKIGEILATGLLEGSYYNVIETTKRKLWGLSKKTSTNTEFADLDRAIEAEFGRVFGFLATSITGAVDMLGLDLNKSLNDFVISLPNISFKDLSGDEIQKELEAIFSQQADLMVQYLVPSMAEYQKMGEGLYDTLIRVAQEQAIFNAQLDALRLQLSRFGDIAAETQIAVAQSIIELMGGIEQFRDLTGQYFSAFYTESEQFEFLSRSLSQAFSDLGLALPDARDSFRDIIDSIDITTDAGQALFAQLMQLVPGLDEYYKALQRQKDAAEKAAEAERKLAEQRAAFASGFERELARLDMSALERTLDDLRTWYAEQIAIAEELGAETEFLERLYARKRADAIAAELDKINTTTANELQRLTSEHERAVSALTTQYQQLVGSITNVSNGIGSAILDIRRQMSGWDETGYQNSIVDSLRGQLGVGDIASQVRTIEQLQQAISARYNAEFAAVNELAQQQQSVINELKSSYEQLQSSIASASAGISSAIDAISGNSDNAGLINSLYSQLSAGTAAEQIGIITQLQNAISARYSAESSAVNALAQQQQNVINELKTSYDQLLSSIQSATAGISSAMLDIQRQMAGWDEIAYQTGQIAELRSQLGSGTAAEQIGVITQLQSAISARYTVELNANRQLQDAASKRYNDELAAVRAMQNAVLQLQQAADAMLLSAASPELLGTQLDEAKRQFDSLLAAANGGDADAARQLQQVGSSYLSIAKDYYAQGSDEYAAIFGQIQSAYRGIGAPAEPPVPAAVLNYQRIDAQIQQAALDELQQLQQLLDELAEQATADNAAQLAEAEAQLAAYQSQTVELQQSAINELQSLQQLLDELAAQAAAENAAQVAAAEAQLAAYQSQIATLQQSAINELSDLQLLLAVLEQQAAADLEQQTEALLAEFNAQTEALLKSQAEQIAAVHNAAETIVAAIKQLPAPVVEVVVPPPPPVVKVPQVTVDLANPVFTPNDRVEVDPRNDELIAQLRDQHNNTTQQNERLVNEIVRMRTELRRTQDLTLAAQRIA